jgi:predicted TIM-barrel fold metal-dependent hydrolase
MAGIRVTFHTEPFANWLDDGSLDWFWNACQRLGIPVMALVPGMVKKLWPVVERHRHLTILIPHMGAISGLRGAGAFGSLDDLIYLARYPRVFVMVSSAPCYSDERYPFRDIQSFLRRIFDAYGARRMLWGSDISRLTCPYRVCLDHIQCLDFLSSEDKEWIVGKTLAEVLNWPEDRPRAAGK